MQSQISEDFNRSYDFDLLEDDSLQSNDRMMRARHGTLLRTVKFHPRVRARQAVQYSQEEKEATWYNSDELEELRLGANLLVQRINNEGALLPLLNDDHDCKRGLEHKLQVTPEFRSRNKCRRSRMAVLSAQQLQQVQTKDGKTTKISSKNAEDSTIASMYSKFSKSSQTLAHARAFHDEYEAGIIKKEDASPSSLSMIRTQTREEEWSPEEELACNNRARTLLARRREQMRQFMPQAVTAV